MPIATATATPTPLPAAVTVTALAPPLRVACYCRYSSHLQDDGLSIPGQHSEHEREWLRDGATPHEILWYDEPHQSAHVETIERRPVFAQLLRDAEAGRFDLVAVWKMDRFSRRLHITTAALQRLQQAGVGFYSLAERFDLTTPAGWLQAHLMGVLADYYSRSMGTDIKRGKDERAREGLPGCRTPFGYRWTGEKSAPEPDQEEDGSGTWDGLLLLFTLSAQGLTDLQVARRLNEDGRWHLTTPSRAGSALRPFTRNAVSTIRRSRFYRPFAPGDEQGTVIHNGVEHRGAHAAAVTWEEWHALQETAQHRRRGWYARGRTTPAHTAEFRGLVACAECGGRLYVWRSVHQCKDGRIATYERYVCTASDRNQDCRQDRRWARVDDVRAAWVAWLEAHTALPEDWRAQIEVWAREELAGGTGGGGDSQDARDEQEVARERAREIARWTRKREAARNLYAEGEIGIDEWHARREEADMALQRLTYTEAPAAVRVQRLTEAALVIREIHALWLEMTTEQRIQVATGLVEPLGMPLRLLGGGPHGEYDQAWAGGRSGVLLDVRLRPTFRELLVAVREDHQAG